MPMTTMDGWSHAPAELRAERLDRLGLARAGGAERVAAEPQRERVRQREVAAVGERRLHEPLAEVEVLEAVPVGMTWYIRIGSLNN